MLLFGVLDQGSTLRAPRSPPSLASKAKPADAGLVRLEPCVLVRLFVHRVRRDDDQGGDRGGVDVEGVHLGSLVRGSATKCSNLRWTHCCSSQPPYVEGVHRTLLHFPVALRDR